MGDGPGGYGAGLWEVAYVRIRTYGDSGKVRGLYGSW